MPASPDSLPFLADRAEAADALALVREFGPGAAAVAAARAERSRDLGNHLHFCRWRQIERMIALMGRPAEDATVH